MKTILSLFLTATLAFGAPKTKTTLESYFETADTPTQAQFEDLLDSIFAEWLIVSDVASGATTLTVTPDAGPMMRPGMLIALGAFTETCELRKINTVSGNTITLTYPTVDLHYANDAVVLMERREIPLKIFGLVSDSAENAGPLFQRALDEVANYATSMWLDLRNVTYWTAEPLIMSSTKLTQGKIQAMPGYTPDDDTNAMLMNQQGHSRVAFTANAGTDVITTAITHGIPADNIPIVFKPVIGGSLPTGLTAGRIYYPFSRTTNTLKVSATSGGAAVDIIGAGSGLCWTEVKSLSKVYIHDITLDGGFLVKNGAWFSIQQPSELNKLRADQFTVMGAQLGGQHAQLLNYESIASFYGLVLEDMSFLYAFALNVEQSRHGIWFKAPIDTGNVSCTIVGSHFEMNSGSGYSTTASEVFKLDSAANLTVINSNISVNSAGPKIIHITGVGGVDGVFENIHVSGFQDAGVLMVDDDIRGHEIEAWGPRMRNQANSITFPYVPTSYLYTDSGPNLVLGMGGRLVASGGTSDSVAMMEFTPGSAQTGDILKFTNNAGTTVSGIKASGIAMTPGGTFTMVAGSKTVADTRVTANSIVQVTLKTASGARTPLDIVPTAATGFVVTGAGTDNGTYNYVITEVTP